MRNVIVVFRSRTDTMRFIEHFKKLGYNARIVNTPKDAKIGCGISAEISQHLINTAKTIVQNKKLNSFYGFYITGNKMP